MSLIKKIDVEAHFAEKRRLRLVRAGLATHPTAKGLSALDAAGAKSKASGFRDDFSIEHSFPTGSAIPAK
jgi:hypothetical protein